MQKWKNQPSLCPLLLFLQAGRKCLIRSGILFELSLWLFADDAQFALRHCGREAGPCTESELTEKGKAQIPSLVRLNSLYLIQSCPVKSGVHARQGQTTKRKPLFIATHLLESIGLAPLAVHPSPFNTYISSLSGPAGKVLISCSRT